MCCLALQFHSTVFNTVFSSIASYSPEKCNIACQYNLLKQKHTFIQNVILAYLIKSILKVTSNEYRHDILIIQLNKIIFELIYLLFVI